MADKNATRARNMFQHHGMICVTDPTTKHVEESGRADFKLLKGGRGVCVEVKFGWQNYAFNQWEDNQRNWAIEYCENPPFSTEYWLFITISDKKTKDLSDVRPHHSWLIPRQLMLDVEQIVSPIQASIRYEVTKHCSLTMRGLQLPDGSWEQQPYDAKHLFAGYEVNWFKKLEVEKPAWVGTGLYKNFMWTIPKQHPFYLKFISERPITVLGVMNNGSNINNGKSRVKTT